MADLWSTDGRYRCVQQGDGNFVVYVTATMTPAWDRWSFEASQEGPIVSVPLPASPEPAPVAARLVKVTDVSDGVLVPRMYSYWSNGWIDPINGAVHIFCGHEDGVPRHFIVHESGYVARVFWPFPYRGTTEGWYWDHDGWITLLDGRMLRRINPATGTDHLIMDLRDFWQNFADCRLWQAHSSTDGQVHSATVQRIVADGPYQNIGTAVVLNGAFHYFPAQGILDESAISGDGRWLLIKEGDDNRIVDLETGDIRVLTDAAGAVGHSDMGADFVVGEDNIHGACVRWDFTEPLVEANRLELFPTRNLGHLCVRGDRCLLSDDRSISLVDLQGGGLTTLVNHGMVGEGYDFQVQANLDPTGRVAVYLSNQGTDRLDLFLLRL